MTVIQEEHHPENEANIARMSRIYGEALFTIVAADSMHKDAGLKGVSSPRDPYEQILEPEMIKDAQIFLPVSVEANYYPWESRAWCFQEKLLSRRMLVFSGGFATWHCAGGVWREDVNALDGAGRSKSIARRRLVPVSPATTELERASLQLSSEDESVRLYRSAAMNQYIKTVEDFSSRDIGESWRILDAFKGVQSLLESSSLLDTPFRFGLPSHFIDVALLWQPRSAVRRRHDKTKSDGTVERHCPPSWSWAGWEAIEEGSKGAAVVYEKPYNIQADDEGLLMRVKPLGEERIRPCKGRIWGKVTNLPKVKQLGMFSLPGMDMRSFKDWETESTRPKPPPPVLRKDQLSDRHLVLHSEITTLYLGDLCYRVRRYTKLGNIECCRDSFEDKEPLQPLSSDTIVSCERWILDTDGQTRVGLVKMNAGSKRAGSRSEQVEAVVLSEAQHLGTEKTVDVLGYPCYNVLILKRTKDGLAERIGLGRVYKNAWRRAGPAKDVVVIE